MKRIKHKVAPSSVVAGYVRKSGIVFDPHSSPSERRALVDHLRSQRVAELSDDAERMGLTVDVFFDDMRISGRGQYLEKRDAFARLNAEAKAGRIGVVVARDLGRLHRDADQQGIWFAEMMSLGVTLYVDGVKQEDTPMSKLIRGLLAHVNEYKADEDSVRFTSALTTCVKTRVWDGRSRAPFGYQRDYNAPKGAKFLIPDPVRALNLARLFELFVALSGNSRKLEKLLNSDADEAFPPHHGLRWHAYNIRKIVANPIYIGITSWGESGPVDVSQFVPSIVDRELALQAQALLLRRAADRTEGRNANRRLYTTYGGMLVCGACGSRMTGIRQVKRGDLYLMCGFDSDHRKGCPASRMIKAHRIDAAVATLLEAVLIAKPPHAPKSPRTPSKGIPARLERVALLEAAKQRLVRLYAMQDIDDNMYAAEIRRINAELAELKAGQEPELIDAPPGLSAMQRDALLRRVKSIWTETFVGCDDTKRELMDALNATLTLTIPDRCQRNDRPRGIPNPDFTLTLTIPGVGNASATFSV